MSAASLVRLLWIRRACRVAGCGAGALVLAAVLALTVPATGTGEPGVCPQGRYWAAPTQSCEPIPATNT